MRWLCTGMGHPLWHQSSQKWKHFQRLEKEEQRCRAWCVECIKARSFRLAKWQRMMAAGLRGQQIFALIIHETLQDPTLVGPRDCWGCFCEPLQAPESSGEMTSCWWALRAKNLGFEEPLLCDHRAPAPDESQAHQLHASVLSWGFDRNSSFFQTP